MQGEGARDSRTDKLRCRTSGIDLVERVAVEVDVLETWHLCDRFPRLVPLGALIGRADRFQGRQGRSETGGCGWLGRATRENGGVALLCLPAKAAHAVLFQIRASKRQVWAQLGYLADA